MVCEGSDMMSGGAGRLRWCKREREVYEGTRTLRSRSSTVCIEDGIFKRSARITYTNGLLRELATSPRSANRAYKIIRAIW